MQERETMISQYLSAVSKYSICLFVMHILLTGCRSDDSVAKIEQPTKEQFTVHTSEIVDPTQWLRITQKLPNELDKNRLVDLRLSDDSPPRLTDGYQAVGKSICIRSPDMRIRLIDELPDHKVVRANLLMMFHERYLRPEPFAASWRSVLELIDTQDNHWKAIGFFLEGITKNQYSIYEIGLWRDNMEPAANPSRIDEPRMYYIYFELPLDTEIIGVTMDDHMLYFDQPLVIK